MELTDSLKTYQGIGGATAELMCDLLSFEADWRAVNITVNRLVHPDAFVFAVSVLMANYL